MNEVKILVVLSNLESLKDMDEFKLYSKTIFECLNSLEDLKRG